jgi:predicted HD phosphohydrolase
LIVLTPNRTDDAYRHRFSAAHELGHLVPHGDAGPGAIAQEREADTLAAEFLTPTSRSCPSRLAAHLAAAVRAQRADRTALTDLDAASRRNGLRGAGRVRRCVLRTAHHPRAQGPR